MNTESRERGRRPVQWGLALGVALLLTLAVFLFLPVMQTIGSRSSQDLIVTAVDIGNLPPPPPPPPDHVEEEEEPPPPPPKLAQEAAPLDLAQLELALNPGFGEGLHGDFTIDLAGRLSDAGGEEEMDRIFSLADLDQRPRVVVQRAPSYPPELRREKRQGTVTILFVVDARGRVVDPKVEKSTDPAFERAALEAVKHWRFEPGTRKGDKVSFKMRVPITFNPG
jgi:protein TonB